MFNSGNAAIPVGYSDDYLLLSLSKQVELADLGQGQTLFNGLGGISSVADIYTPESSGTAFELQFWSLNESAIGRSVALDSTSQVCVRRCRSISSFRFDYPDLKFEWKLADHLFTAPWWISVSSLQLNDYIWVPWISQQALQTVGASPAGQLIPVAGPAGAALRDYRRSRRSPSGRCNPELRLSAVDKNKRVAGDAMVADKLGLWVKLSSIAQRPNAGPVVSLSLDHVGSVILNGYAVRTGVTAAQRVDT